MSSVFELIRRRAMCRRYQDRAVPVAHLNRILEAARRAPSAGHSQGVRFGVTTDPVRRQAIADAFGEQEYLAKGFQPWLSVAPVHIVACLSEASYQERYAAPDKSGDPSDWPVSYPVMDVGQALMTLYLAAEECGLSCGYLGPHAGPDLGKMLDLPQEWRFMGLITLGYRLGTTRKTRSIKRGWREFDEVVRWI